MADVTGEFYASEGFIGYGAEFLVGQGATGSPLAEDFVAIPEVNSISPLVSGTTPVGDFTHLRSPNRHREKKPLIRDSGAITLNANYRPGHGAHKVAGGDGFNAAHSVLSLWRSCAENNFLIRLPDAAGLVGSPAADQELPLVGAVTKYEIGELGVDGKVPCMIEVTPLRDYFTH